MGVYVFAYPVLAALLADDAADGRLGRDFGGNVIPAALRHRRVCAFPFAGTTGRASARPYWRDVGTLESYWQPHMELLEPASGLDLDDPRWPIRTYQRQLPPARFDAADGDYASVRRSIVSAGCTLGASGVRSSVLSRGVRVGTASLIEESVVLPGARIGDRCWLRRAWSTRGARSPTAPWSEKMRTTPASGGPRAGSLW